MTRADWRRTHRPKATQRRNYAERRAMARRRLPKMTLRAIEGTCEL